MAIASRQQKIGPPKRIIFCADGTWDSAQGETNVSKFYNYVLSGSDQVAIYDDALGPNDWQDFLGLEKSPEAEYRVPLLMMAVAAAYPGFASQWLRNVVAEKGWMPAVEVGGDGKGSHTQSEWDQLTEKIREINATEFAPFDDATVRKWCPMVRRYFF